MTIAATRGRERRHEGRLISVDGGGGVEGERGLLFLGDVALGLKVGLLLASAARSALRFNLIFNDIYYYDLTEQLLIV